MAGAENNLVCPECGEPVILKAGPIRTPHFAHKATPGKRQCDYWEKENESEIHRRAKEVLYHYFTRKYPLAKLIMPEYKLPNGRRADLYIKFDSDKELAIEFQKSNIQLQEWRERHDDYVQMNIKDIWLLYGTAQKLSDIQREYKLNLLDHTILLESLEERLLYLDVNERKITIMRLMHYRGAVGQIINYRLFSKNYSLDAILIEPNGDIDSDFQKEFEKAYKDFTIECSGSLYYEDFVKNKLPKPQLQTFTPSTITIKKDQKTTYKPPDENKVSTYVQRAIEGSQNCLGIIRRIVIDGGTHESQLVARLFKESYELGHEYTPYN